MDFGTLDEASNLLSNGILMETNKGLICMTLNDALSSNLNLSVDDLKCVAKQLLLQQNTNNMATSTSSQEVAENFADSDGFTSESSDVCGIANCGLKSTLTAVKISSSIISTTPNYVNCKVLLQSSTNTKSSESENMSSTISDSDASSIILNVSNRNVPDNMENKALCSDITMKDVSKLNDSAKLLPIKKRGGWPKGRKRKPELLHLPPKAPATGYNLFLNDQRKLIKDSNLPFHEKTKLIGNRWSSLSLEEKRPYLEKAEEEKRRYRVELRQYTQSGAYQLYLANKRKKRAQYNVFSESDMDATDDIDDEDNEELYCRTCDQWFHNLHNKKEHLQGRQHQQSIAGAITRELNSDYDTDAAGTSLSFSTSLDESSLDGSPMAVTGNGAKEKDISESVSNSIANLISVVNKRETEIKTLGEKLQQTKNQHQALYQQLCSLKETEMRLKKQLLMLKEQEKDMELKVFHLWQVPSWFIITDLNQTADFNLNE